MAHEFGHTMLLAHHNDNDCLMKQGSGGETGPRDCDLGFAEPDDNIAPCDFGQPDDFGIRCIFGWWREQYGVERIQPWYIPKIYLDCPDLNRDKVIDLPNDILGTVLSFLPGGGLSISYFPDADFNNDGVVDLPNDILQTILRFDPGGPGTLPCDKIPPYYSHS